MRTDLRSSLTSLARAPRRWLLAGALGGAVAAVLALPQLGLAHAKLRSSLPAANSTVSAPPKELRLTFSEKPELAVSRVTLLAAGKDTVATGRLVAVRDSAETVVVPLSATLGPGSYTVRYRVVGRDGHPIAGSFAFTVEAAR